MRYISRFKDRISGLSIHSLAFMMMFSLVAGLSTYQEAAAQNPSVTLTADVASVDEDAAAAATVTVTATLATAMASDQTVTVSVPENADRYDSDGAGTAIADFDIVVAAGNLSNTGTFDIFPTDDAEYLGDLTVAISGVATGSFVTGTSLTIKDEDADLVITSSVASVGEAAGETSITITVTTEDNANLADATTINLTFDGASGGYTIGGTQSITIASGSSNAASVITLTPVVDGIYTGDRDITVSGTAGALTIFDATIALTDAEAAPTATLAAAAASVAEDGGAETITVTGTLSHGSATDVSIDITVAANATFWEATAPSAITIAAGQTEGTTTFTLTPVDDEDYDGDQTVALSSATNTGLSANPANVNVTIVDEDFDYDFSASVSAITEDGGAQAVVVTATVADGGTADAITTVDIILNAGAPAGLAIAGTQSITVDVGQSSGTATITLTPTDDAIYTGDQDVIIESDTAGLDVGPVTITLSEDEAVPTVVLTSDVASIAEEVGAATTVTITATLSGLSAVDETITVSVAENADRWDADGAGAAIADFDIVVTAGNASNTGTFDVEVTDDDTYLGDAVIAVSGVSDNELAVTGADINLVDEDFDVEITVSTSEADNSIVEGASWDVTVTATAPGALAETTTITLTADTSVDAGLTLTGSSTITIAAGSANNSTIWNVVPTDNDVYNGAREIPITGVSGSDTIKPVILALVDDESPPTGTLTADVDLTEEGGAQVVTITATLTNASDTASEIELAVAENATFWEATEPAAITIAAGETTGTSTTTITPVSNDTYDGDQSIGITAPSSSGLSADPAGINVALVDDDFDINLTANVSSITEDGGAQSVVITAALPEGETADAITTVDIILNAGAPAGLAIGGTQSITIGVGGASGTATITLTPTDDAVWTGDQDVIIESDTAGIAVSPTELTLTEDEADLTVALTSDVASIAEDVGAAVTVTITATLSGEAAADQTITVSVAENADRWDADGAGTAIADYNIVVTAGNTTQTGTFDVTVTDDSAYLGDTVIAVSGVSDNDLAVTGVDIDLVDEDFDIELTVADGTVAENAGVQSQTVTATVGGGGNAAEAITVELGFTLPDGVTIGGTTQLTIAGGSASSTTVITVTPTEDETYTGDQSIAITGTSGALDIKPTSIVLSDKEAAPTATLTAAAASVAEEGGEETITITGTLSHASGVETTIDLAVAANATFWEATEPAAITIAAGETTGTSTFALTPVDDEDYDGDQTVAVSSPSNTGLSAAPADVNVTIVDEDFDVSLSASVASITEDGGAQSVVITATAPEAVEAAVTVTLDIAAGGPAGLAIAGTQSITIGAGALSAASTITLTPTPDSERAGDETITIENTAAGVDVSPATIAYVDAEAVPTVTLTTNVASIAEEVGAATVVTITATLNHAANENIVVTVTPDVDETLYALDETGTATDLTEFDITIAASATTATGQFDITPVDDATYLGDITIQVAGTAPSTWGDLAVTGTSIDIVDEDFDLEITVVGNVNENGGETSVQITVGTADAQNVASSVTAALAFTRPTGETESSLVIAGTTTVTIAGGSNTGTSIVTVTPTEDGIYTGDRVIDVTATSGDLVIKAAEISLIDTEAAPTATLTAAAASVAEEGGEETITITGTLSHASGVETTIDLAVAANATFWEATEPAAITIAAGETTGTSTFALTPVDDEDYDGDQTVAVSSPSNTGLSAAPADVNVTIVDEDFDVSLSASVASITEDGAAQSVVVTATLPAAADAITTVDIILNAGAPAGLAIAGTQAITIGVGASTGTATITLTPTDDAIYTGDQDVIIESDTVGITESPVTITLSEDEAVPTVVLTSDVASIAEEVGAATTVTITATLSVNSAVDETITVSVADGAGRWDADGAGAAIADFDIVVTAGNASNTGTFDVEVTDDDTYLGDAVIAVSGVSDNELAVTGADINLVDEDFDVELTVADGTVTEAGGTQSQTVTATLPANAAEAMTVTLDITRPAGETESSLVIGGTSTITIAGGSNSATAVITVAPTEDGIYTGDRDITIAGTSGDLQIKSTTVSLTDAEAAPTATLTAAAASVAEDGGAETITITGTLSHGSATDVTIDLAVAANATFWEATEPAAITIAAGQTEGTTTFALTPVDDEDYDGDQTVAVSSPSNTGLSAAPADVNVSIVDEDFDVTLSADISAITEDGGAQSVVITATLPAAADAITSFNIVLDGGAPAGLAIGGTQGITIGVGASTGTTTITLTPTDDAVWTGDQDVIITEDTAGVTDAPVTITLSEDEADLTVALTSDVASIAEDVGAAVTVTITATLSGEAAADQTITVSVAENADRWDADGAGTAIADYNIVVTAGNTTQTGTFDVTVTDDSAYLGDTVIAVSGVSDNDLAVTGVDIDLVDEDFDAELTVANGTVTEDGGTQSQTVTATLPANAVDALDITLGFTWPDGETESTLVIGGTTTITIAAGSNSGTAVITVAPTADGTYTDGRTIAVTGTSGELDIKPTSIALTDIENAPSATLTHTPTNVYEEQGDQLVTVSAELSLPSSAATTIDIAVAENAAWAATAPDAIVVAAGSLTGSTTFTLTPVDNETYDGDLTVAVSSPSNDGLAADPANIDVNIIDDDFDIILSVTPSTIDEDGTGHDLEIQGVLAGGALETATTVALTYTLPAGRVLNTDVTIAGSSADLTIPPGETSATTTLTVTVDDDSQMTGDQEIAIAGTSAGLDIQPTALVVLDAQAVQVTLTHDVAAEGISENSDPVSVVVTATQSDLQLTATTVTLSTGGTATADEDYTVTGDLEIQIPSGELTGTTTLTISPINDFTAESDGTETIIINGSAGDYRIITSEFVINDHNLVPLASVSLSPATLSEGSGAVEVTITATLDGTSSEDITVQTELGADSDTAVDTSDFNVADLDSFTIPAGDGSATAVITVTPVDDNEVETDELFSIGAWVTDGEAAVGDKVYATITLTDNDATTTPTTFTLTSDKAGITEGVDADVVITATASSAVSAVHVINLVPKLAETTIDLEDAPALFATFNSGMSITLNPGDTSGTFTIAATTVDDSVYEGDEVVIFEGQVGGELTNELTLSLLDDDAPTVSVTSSATTLQEASGVQRISFTATMTSGAVESATNLTLTANNGTADASDYNAPDATLTIAAGETTGTAEVAFSIADDNVYEPTDETIIVSVDFRDNTGLAEITLNIEDNFSAPAVASALGAVQIEAGTTWSGDLAASFTGKALSYTASSSGGAATAAISGSSLAITGVSKGSARVSVVATNAAGSANFDMDVTVTATTAERAVYESILAGFGRNVMSSVGEAIGGRLAVDNSQRSGLRLANQKVDGLASGVGALIGLKAIQPTDKYGLTDNSQRNNTRRPVTSQNLMRGTDFYYALDDTPQSGTESSSLAFTVWGSGDWNAFEGGAAGSSYDGTLKSGYIGLDVSNSTSWTAGVAVGRATGTTDYDVTVTDGTLETTLNSVYPYLQWTGTGGNLEVWGIGGFGSGEAEANGATEDLSMSLGMVGMRAQLMASSGGLDVDLIGDAGVTKISTAVGQSASLSDLEASVQRLRIGLEASKTSDLGNGLFVTPYAELAGRIDGGDGETGNGLEVAGGLRIVGGRAGLEARGRFLAVHTGEEVKEHGLSLVAYVRPMGAGGQGLSLSLAPRLGADTQMSNNMWREESMNDIRFSSKAGAAVKAEIGYGLVHPAVSNILVTPFGTMDMAGSEKRRMRLGARFGSISSNSNLLSFELAGERIQGSGRITDHRIGLLGRMSF